MFLVFLLLKFQNLLEGDKVVGGEDAKGDCCWFAKVIIPEDKGEFITEFAAVTDAAIKDGFIQGCKVEGLGAAP